MEYFYGVLLRSTLRGKARRIVGRLARWSLFCSCVQVELAFCRWLGWSDDGVVAW